MTQRPPRPPPRVFDLRRIKEHVRRNFEPGHPLREAVLREPDELPVDAVLLGRLLTYLNLAPLD